MSNIIEVKDLKKRYGSNLVVKGVSFFVKKGEIFGILGPNGAGKTTTLEMLEGLRPIDVGQVTLGDIDVVKHPHKVKQVIGVQLQSTNFFDHLNLEELLRMFGGMYHSSVDAGKLLREVNLEDKAKSEVGTLSGGQKQRFSVASALVNNPLVLFLDEPTTGLDPQARRNLWDLIQIVQKKGITIVMTTHYMDEAELLCDRVAVMDQGKIVALDTPSNLVKSLLKKGFKKEIEVQQANLEDVFIELTGKALRD